MKATFIAAHTQSFKGFDPDEPFCYPWPLPEETILSTRKKIQNDGLSVKFEAERDYAPHRIKERTQGPICPGRLVYDIYGRGWRVLKMLD